MKIESERPKKYRRTAKITFPTIMQPITTPTVNSAGFIAAPVIVDPNVPSTRLLVETAPGKYTFPEDHPFSLDFNTILHILSFLGKIDLLSVKWTCTTFMAHLAGPRRDPSLIAEAAACGNVPMYRALSSGTWIAEKYPAMYKHVYSVVDRRVDQEYSSCMPDDFFAIADNFFDICTGEQSFQFSHKAIHMAARRGRTDVVLFLLDNMTDVGRKLGHRMIVNATISAGHADTLYDMIQHDRFRIGVAFSTRKANSNDVLINNSMLTTAIQKNHLEMVCWMMAEGMRPSGIEDVIEDISVEMMMLIIEYHFEMSVEFLSEATRVQRVDLVRELLVRRNCSHDDVDDVVFGFLQSMPEGTFDEFIAALGIDDVPDRSDKSNSFWLVQSV